MTFDDALTAFLLSREAINCKPRTLDWYRQQIGRFHEWLLEQSWNGSTWLQPEVLEAFLGAERRLVAYSGRADRSKVVWYWLLNRRSSVSATKYFHFRPCCFRTAANWPWRMYRQILTLVTPIIWPAWVAVYVCSSTLFPSRP